MHKKCGKRMPAWIGKDAVFGEVCVHRSGCLSVQNLMFSAKSVFTDRLPECMQILWNASIESIRREACKIGIKCVRLRLVEVNLTMLKNLFCVHIWGLELFDIIKCFLCSYIEARII